MTFNSAIPNPGKSPSLFPAENQTNMARLRANINRDHNFLDTLAAGNGIHKQCTFMDRLPVPTGFPGGNGILYSAPDPNTARSQLFWYNGTERTQITPIPTGFVRTISGTSVLNANKNDLIFANPGYSYQAYVFGSLQDSNVAACVGNAIRFSNGSTLTIPAQILANLNITGTESLVIGYIDAGNPQNLYIRHQGGSTSRTFVWTVLVVQLP